MFWSAFVDATTSIAAPLLKPCTASPSTRLPGASTRRRPAPAIALVLPLIDTL
jgi:hypothetical protein